MPSAEQVQTLVEKRAAAIKGASENRDVDDLMSWHSESATYVSPANNITISGKDHIRGFYAAAYAAMPTFSVKLVKLTGPTPEFMAVEMECEGKADSDQPAWGLKAGDSLKLKGVSLFWWKWEGSGSEWDGSLDDEVVRGWKIVEEHAYHTPVQ